MNAMLMFLGIYCGQPLDSPSLPFVANDGSHDWLTVYPTTHQPEWAIWHAAMLIESGEYADAIYRLYWAHQFDPTNQLAAQGLIRLRDEAPCPTGSDARALRPEREWYPGCLFAPWLAILGFFAWCAACFAFARAWRFHAQSWLITGLLLIAIAGVPVANEIVRSQRKARDTQLPFIVVERSTELRAGNGTEYPLILNVPRSTECRFITRRHEWCLVEFASGMTGWIREADLCGTPPEGEPLL